MWDALETLHEGTEDVKKSKINTLVQQYELFHMEDGETISSMKTSWTKIVLTRFWDAWLEIGSPRSPQ